MPQKYTDKEYLDAEYFEPDEEITNHAMKIVTTRTEHECSSVFVGHPHVIPPNTKAILETAIHADDGRVSNYLCLSCADQWLDHVRLLGG